MFLLKLLLGLALFILLPNCLNCLSITLSYCFNHVSITLADFSARLLMNKLASLQTIYPALGYRYSWLWITAVLCVIDVCCLCTHTDKLERMCEHKHTHTHNSNFPSGLALGVCLFHFCQAEALAHFLRYTQESLKLRLKSRLRRW